jgi:DNA-directed RNA polymerase subunit alpha
VGLLTQQELAEHPRVEIEQEEGGWYARMAVAPLPPGWGTTLGNSLRRVLLSSLPGAAITKVRIEGVLHEFSTIPHVKEDTVDFLLNVKEIRLRALSDRPGTLVLDLEGREGEIKAGDLQVPEHFEIVNPEQHLLTVDSPDARLYIEFTAEIGRGYQPASQSDGLPIGVIPVDAIFSPVRKVSYQVEPMRVGQASNYEKLVLEVWTDGTITAVEAVNRSAEMLVQHLRLFSGLGKPSAPVLSRGIGTGLVLPPDLYNMPVEELNLSMRSYNCLRRSGIFTLGQLLEKSEEDLLSLRNFGRKSYDELRQRLAEMGIIPLQEAPAQAAPEEEEELEEAETEAEAAPPEQEEEQQEIAATAPAVEEEAPAEATETETEAVEAQAPEEAEEELPEEIDPRLAKLRELKKRMKE